MPRVLDLFSGIGGMTLALQPLGYDTVSFCENDASACAILENNMRRELLPNVPIHPDVRTLTKRDLPTRVDCITAGFPCQGLSTAGKKAGLLADSRSALIVHVLRLVRALRPALVFLENSTNIVRDSHYDDLLQAFTDAGYVTSFMFVAASQVGGVHLRRRWFLLAARPDARAVRSPKALRKELFMIPKPSTQGALLARQDFYRWGPHICKAFGNAVVPAQARYAFVSLMSALQGKHTDCIPLGALPRHSKDLQKPVVRRKDGSLWSYAPHAVRPQTCAYGPFHIHLKSSRSKTSPKLRKEVLPDGTITIPCMPTVRASPGCYFANSTMTARTIHDPGTAALLCPQAIGRRLRDPSRYMLSDGFWAQIMGFPPTWIRAFLEKSTRHRKNEA